MKTLSSLLLFSLLFTTYAVGQTAEEIIKQYIETKGGPIALTKLISLKQVDNVKSEATNYQTANFHKGPAYKTTFSYEGLEIKACFDGKTVWATNPITMKNEVLNEEDARDIVEQARDFPDALFKASRNRYQVVREEDKTINGKPCFTISLLKPDYIFMGTTIKGKTDFYIEKASYLLLKTELYNANGKMETYYTNFKEKDGIVFPYSSKVMMNGIQINTSDVQSIEVNPKINSAIFLIEK